jgi:hypothetical protein
LWWPSKEVVDGIVDNCPNLQHLELGSVKYDGEENAALVGSIKSGLKKLAKFKLESILWEQIGRDISKGECGYNLIYQSTQSSTRSLETACTPS